MPITFQCPDTADLALFFHCHHTGFLCFAVKRTASLNFIYTFSTIVSSTSQVFPSAQSNTMGVLFCTCKAYCKL